jgi:hypothetical protein
MRAERCIAQALALLKARRCLSAADRELLAVLEG